MILNIHFYYFNPGKPTETNLAAFLKNKKKFGALLIAATQNYDKTNIKLLN